MTDLLARIFIKDYKNTKSSEVKEAYGKFSSVVGISVNLLLAILKFAIGTILGSIAIRADAANNLSDAASSVISLFSFQFSNKPADAEHPFGHARFEYAASFAVAFFILMMGVEIFRSSIGKIIKPDVILFSTASCIILLFSIISKLWLALFYKRIGKRIKSKVLGAAAADSLADVVSTSGVLLSLILSNMLNVQLDGYAGLLIAVFIVYTGTKVMKDTLDEFLGQPPDESFVRDIEEKILSYDGILGVHDLVVHNYGPQKTFASVHVEVLAQENILKSHEIIDGIERDFLNNDGIDLLIHIDPVVTDDEFVNELKESVFGIVSDIDSSFTAHDFRVVSDGEHKNLVFDVVVPFEFSMTDDEIIGEIKRQIKKIDKTYNVTITIDKANNI